jgi:hypothetical protein
MATPESDTGASLVARLEARIVELEARLQHEADAVIALVHQQQIQSAKIDDLERRVSDAQWLGDSMNELLTVDWPASVGVPWFAVYSAWESQDRLRLSRCGGRSADPIRKEWL